MPLDFILNLILAIIGAFFFVLAVTTICTQNKEAQSRLNKEVTGSSFDAVINGTLQSSFKQRRRLTVANGLKAKRKNGKIKISPQGKFTREAIRDSFSKR